MKVVETRSHSRYVIDEQLKQFLRVPGVDANDVAFDGKPVNYDEILVLRVGLPMEILWDDHSKIRRSTTVVSIQEMI